MEVGSLFATLGLKSTEFDSGMARAEQRMQNAGNSFEKSGGLFSNILSTAGGFLTSNILMGIGGQAADLGKQFISSNADFESYGVSFKTLLGNSEDFKNKYRNVTDPLERQALAAQAAQERMDALAKFGAATPFELPGIIEADTILQGFGLHSEESAKKFGFSGEQIRTIAGDVASGTGAEFSEMSLLLGKFSAGATGEAISRMMELGITTREELAGMGLEFSKSGELLSPLPESMNTVLTLMKGKYGGLMNEQSATFNGMLSNLQDWIGGTIRTLGQPIFEVAGDKLKGLLAFLNDPATAGAMQGFADFLASSIGSAMDFISGTVIPGFVAAWNTIAPIIEGVWNSIQLLLTGDFSGGIFGLSEDAPFINALFSAREILVTLGEQVAAFLTQLAGPVETALGMFGTAFEGALLVLDGFVAALLGTETSFGDWSLWFESLAGTLGEPWANAIYAIIDVVYQLRDTLMGAMPEIGSIVDTLGTVWNNLSIIVDVAIQTILAIVTYAFGSISAFLDEHSAQIQTIIQTAWDLISGIVTGVLTFVANFVAENQEGIVATFKTVWDTIMNVIDLALDLITEVVIPALTAIAEFIAANQDTIRAVIQTAWDTIRGVIDGAMKIINGIIKTVMAVIHGDWAGAWDGIKQILSGAWQVIQTIVSGAVDILKGTISVAWDAIKGVTSAAWGWIKDNIIGPALEGIKSLVAAGNAFLEQKMGGTWNTIKSLIQNAWETIKGVVQAATTIVQGVIDLFMGVVTEDWGRAWDGIKTILSGAWDGIKTIVSGSIENIKGLLSLAWDAIKATASVTWDGIKTLISSTWDGIKTTVTTALDVIKNYILDGMGTIESETGIKLDAVRTAFTTAWDAIQTAVQTAFTTIEGIVSGGIETITGIVRGAIGAMTTAATSIGSALVDGIKSGINAGLAGIRSVVEGLANSIPAWAKKMLGIASPSKVMRDQIGKQIPAGIADGIQATRLLPLEALSGSIDELTSGIVPLVGGMIDTVTNIISRGSKNIGAATEAITGFGDASAATAEQLEQLMTPMYVLPGKFGKVTGATSETAGAITKTRVSLEDATAAFNALVPEVRNNEQAFEGIRPAVDAVTRSIEETAGTLRGTFNPSVNNAALALENTLDPALDTTAGNMRNGINPAISSVQDTLDNVLNPSVNGVAALFRDALDPALDTTTGKVGDTLKGAADRLAGTFTEGTAPAITRLAGVFNEQLSPAITGTANDLLFGLHPQIDGLATWLKETASPAISGATGKFDALGTAIGTSSGTFSGLKSTADIYLEGMVTSTGTAVDEMIAHLERFYRYSGNKGPFTPLGDVPVYNPPLAIPGGTGNDIFTRGAGTVNNYNLSVATVQSMETVAADFQMMQAMAG